MVMNSVASEKFITALTFKNFLNIRLLLHLHPPSTSHLPDFFTYREGGGRVHVKYPVRMSVL